LAPKADIAGIRRQLEAIAERAVALEEHYGGELAAVHDRYRASARNLVHYLALRQEDVCPLQESLAGLGLSSLGRSERNVMGSIRAVMSALDAIAEDDSGHASAGNAPLEFRDQMVAAHKAAILGDPPDGREVSIMVTLPAAAARSSELVMDMLDAGMNVARINCAHDDAAAWQTMVANIRQASGDAGKSCRILMDLAGPKVRTGELPPGPRVFHVRPRRDPKGRTIAPRRVRFIPDDTPWQGKKTAVIPLPRECIGFAAVGDVLACRDTRGKKRRFPIVEKDERGMVAEAVKGAYIETGMRMRLRRKATGESLKYRVGNLPPIEQPLLLRPGDPLRLGREAVPGSPAVRDAAGDVINAASIACRQPEVFDYVAPGHRVSLDDGKIEGIVDEVGTGGLEITITRAKPTGSRLRADRGINFPDSDITMPGLTAIDRDNLEFVVAHADAVGLSFVRTPADVRAVQDALRGRALGLVIKVETQRAFRNLPELLLTAMRQYPVAVMIARGDLAVEAGWARLAELQEEILWLCEAAQIPVIWATQVLEGTAKRGHPSRAEISDASLSQRADCVMLNKGPHIIAAIRMLDNILRRMQGHQYKKTPRLRKLSFSIE